MTRQLYTLRAVISAMLIAVSAGVASAEKLEFMGTHTIKFTSPPLTVSASGNGIAEVGTNGSGHLTTVQLPRNFATINTEIPVTDPVVTAGGIKSVFLTDVRIDPQAQGGIFRPISGAIQGSTTTKLSIATMPLAGTIRICLFYSGCNSGAITQTLAQSTTSGFRIGPGVGGTISVGGNTFAISVVGAPWTVGPVTVLNQTSLGGASTLMSTGFAHGPASGTSSTALPGGVLQLVTPSQVNSPSIPGNNKFSGQINILTLHFIPEPGILLLLSSGAIGMAVMGRKRLK